MNRKLKNILIVTIVTLSILAVLEVVSRLVLSRIYDRSFDSSLIEKGKYGQTDGLKANASGTVWGKPFHTDDMGGRKETKSKSCKRKAIVIGDSVTEGVGVDDSSTFCNMANNGNGFDDVDIRNISMIGWSTSDYRNVVDHLIGKDTSIETVYLFYCLNDIYGKTATKNLPAIANKGFASSINAFLQDRYATYKLIKLCLYQHSDHYFQYDQALYHDTARVDEVIEDLVHIKKVCDVNKVKVTIFILPYRSQLYNRNNNLPQKILARRLAENNIECIDLLKSWHYFKNYDDLFLFADEIHLSAKGHIALDMAIFKP